MARIDVEIHFESDLIDDCIADLVRVHMALSQRHGERFRRLERRIEALESGPVPHMDVERLEVGRFIMVPPASWVDMITEARSMGVI